MLLNELRATSDGYSYGNNAQEIIWDVGGCSNINPIFDRKTAMLTTGKSFGKKHCTAIRRDMKLSDDLPYCISVNVHSVAGPISCTSGCANGKPSGIMGIMFNVFDADNYEYVRMSLCSGNPVHGKVTNGVQGPEAQFGNRFTCSSCVYTSVRLCVRKNGMVAFSARGLYPTASGNFNGNHNIKGHGGVMLINGLRTVAQFSDYNLKISCS